ncbi:hypothetical protein OS493_003556 [Desmophyllum pertusum]|uniref:Uncharacterized protein n=1 Tax=Desmophyllum pertusum TaxID=174260 RepID=A0A9X0A6V2_9CNID|nr:hypothetical protein OS493_003556 [Desmophyllum pertusum]
MKKAIQRNAKQDEHLSSMVRQLDREKRVAFNQLSEKREAFVRETVKRRLSLPVVEKTQFKEISAEYGRRKASSVDEGKGVSFSLHFPNLMNSNEKREQKHVSFLGAKTRRDSNSKVSESEDPSFTSQNSDICRLPSLKVEKEDERLRLTAQQRSYKPRSLSIPAAPSFNDTRILKRRATLHNCKQPFNLESERKNNDWF